MPDIYERLASLAAQRDEHMKLAAAAIEKGSYAKASVHQAQAALYQGQIDAIDREIQHNEIIGVLEQISRRIG